MRLLRAAAWGVSARVQTRLSLRFPVTAEPVDVPRALFFLC